MWTHSHLTSIEPLSVADIECVLDRAEAMHALSRAPVRRSDSLRGKTIVTFFFEASTRTRTSFELAAKRLGADVLSVSPSASSVTKGETLLDTALNIRAMQCDALVVRHASSGAADFLARRVGTSLVSAGDGEHEHPTQALLDAFTIRRSKKRLDGLVVAICGDILHSRVARSNAILLGKMGARVRFAGPRTMMPLGATGLGATVEVTSRIEDAVEGADVVMMLRIQHERLAGAIMSTTREYARTFGLNSRVLALAKPDAIVMHPGPINRGVELDSAIADGPRSVILDQVEAGVAVRMAVLELIVLDAARSAA
jgi:aspartate carbamoyltransferase catalytic subunit